MNGRHSGLYVACHATIPRITRMFAAAALLALISGCAADQIADAGRMFYYDCIPGAPECDLRAPSPAESANLAAMVERWADNGCEDIAMEINFVSVMMWDAQMTAPLGGTYLGDYHLGTGNLHIWAGQSLYQQGITLGHELLHKMHPESNHNWFDSYVEYCSQAMT